MVSQESIVKRAKVNWFFEVKQSSLVTNDTYYYDLWGMHRIGASAAWHITQGSEDVVIAILDDGVDLDHEDLAENILKDGNGDPIGINTTNDDNSDPEAFDNGSHGTSCAGIAAGLGNNNKGVVGACNMCKIMSVKILYPDDLQVGVFITSEAWTKEGIEFATNNGANILSMSFGGGIDYSDVKNELIAARNNGVVPIASSGNFGGSPIKYPARYSSTIAVGSTIFGDNRSSFSQYSNELDIMAPGEDIYTTTLNGNYTSNFPGTSASVPHVSGTVGLMLSVDPTLTPDEIQSILQNTTTKVSGMNGQNTHIEYGYGLLNSLRAVYKVQRNLVQGKKNNYESLSSDASGTNNGRRIVYDQAAGTYHIVYQSGSEILYYRRPPWGSPTQPVILTDEQQNDIGRNENPVIAQDNNGVLHLVWQRFLYEDNLYTVFHKKSTNGGVTWSSEQKVSPIALSGPMNPQILAFDSYYNNEVMLTYYFSGNIRAKIYNHSSGNFEPWDNISPTTDVVPYTSVYTRNLSAIAASGYGYGIFNIAYHDDSNNNIYYNFYNGPYDWYTEKNLSSIVPGTASHHSPSIGSNPSSTSAIHVAWTRTTGSGNSFYDNKIVHRFTSNAQNWPNVYYTTYYQAQTKPSITGVSGNSAHLIYELQFNNGIAHQEFNGSSWSYPVTITTNGKFPSISVGGTEAKFLYTEENGPYYDVNLSSQTYSKSSSIENSYKYERSISFSDTSGSYIEFIISNLQVRKNDFISSSLNLKGVAQDTVDLSLSRALKNLAIADLEKISTENLHYDLMIKGNRIADLFKDGIIPDILIANQNLMDNSQDRRDELRELNDYSEAKIFHVSVPNSLIKDDLNSLVKLEMYNFNDGVIASLGHNYVENISNNSESDSVSILDKKVQNLELNANPNPFNPSTYINFTIPKNSFVSLIVYDLLGREVANLVDEELTKGTHRVLFNGGNLASGVYLYRLEASGNVILSKMTLIK